jgi:hypothetical protein
MGPARNALKTVTMSMTREAAQASGASLRSLTTKFGQSKRDPNKFYGMVGVNRKYREAIVDQKPLMYQSLSLYRQVSFGIKNRRPGRNGSPFQRRYQPKEVRSFYRRRPKRDTLRKPSRYWHLTNFGFTHYKAGPVEGYHLVEEALEASREQCMALFRATVIRKFKEAFR